MENTATKQESGLLYEADETPPVGLTLGLGLQMALLCVCTIVVNPTIVYRTAGQPAETIAWAVFVSLLIAGAITVLHACPTRRIGSGYLLVASTTSGAIAVSVDALTAGGQGLLLTLMIASALFQVVFSSRIAAFRRILTPTVTGTMLMLIPVTIAPINFERLTDVPNGHDPWSGAACALVTLGLTVLIAFRGSRRVRPWGPLIGIVAGTLLAGTLGLYDLGGFLRADWIGIPAMAWPTQEPNFGPAFWGLLPAFLMVSMAYTVRATSVAIAIQDVSWRTPRAPDLRVAQRTIAADAGGNVLAGLAGGMFNTTRTSTISLTQATGVAARRVGLVIAGGFAVFAFMPKIIALIVALPGPVVAAYITVGISALFVTGMKAVVSEGLEYRQVLITGLSFWIGVGCEYGFILPDTLEQFAGGLLNNGLAAGGLTAIAMTVFLEVTSGKRSRIDVNLDVSSLPKLRAFSEGFAKANGWTNQMTERLEAVTEETLLTLTQDESDTGRGQRRLRVLARKEGGGALLEFIARTGDGNIEDRIAILQDPGNEHQVEREVSLKLLRHLATEIRHRQYHDMDFVTIRIENTQDERRLRRGWPT